MRHILIFPAILLVSCATDSNKEKSEPVAAPQGARERSVADWVSEKSKDNGFKKDAAGNWIAKSDKRSPYDGMGEDPNFAGKSFKKQEYQAGDYSKKSWWGNKEYDRKAYAGKTDGSRFQKSSDLDGKGARETDTDARMPEKYDTNSYATNAAREAGNSPIKKSGNDLIENRRNSYEQPGVIDYREQRQMSMDQSKGILGR